MICRHRERIGIGTTLGTPSQLEACTKCGAVFLKRRTK